MKGRGHALSAIHWKEIPLGEGAGKSVSISLDGIKCAYSFVWNIKGWQSQSDVQFLARNDIGKRKAKVSLITQHDNSLQLRVTFIGLSSSVQCNLYGKLCNQNPSRSIENQTSQTISPGSTSISLPIPLPRPQFTPQNGWFPQGTAKLVIQIGFGDETKTRSMAPSGRPCTLYAGLLNQGATCYMNSMLQALFHLPAFRSIVFRMPTTGSEDPTVSIPLCLQRLFYRMQTSTEPCSTKDLTVSFGWDRGQTSMQHDAQEFSRVLIENLERKLQGTEMCNDIANLFRGRQRTVIRCKHVPWETSHVENFYDLTLRVQGCSNIAESFLAYIEDGRIDSFDYQTGDFGTQEAERWQEFVSFPDVLQIHLSRVAFDMATGRARKVNDRFEFPPVLDLSAFAPATDGKSNVYELFSVLIHSGQIRGHYAAFIRTTNERRWFKFNDAKVTEETEEAAIESNFGGKSLKFAAYLLMYVRQSEIERIYGPVSFIPEHLIEYEARRATSDGEKLKIVVFDEETLKRNALVGQRSFDNPEAIAELELPACAAFSDVYSIVTETLHLPETSFRLWKTNNGFSVLGKSEKMRLEGLTRGCQQLSLFLQRKPPAEKILVPEMKPMMMVVIKFFFPHLENPFRYIDLVCVSSEWPINRVLAGLREKLGLEPDSPLLCFLENNTPAVKTAHEVDLSRSFAENSVSCGRSLIFQALPGSVIPPSPFNVDVPCDTPPKPPPAEDSDEIPKYDAFDLVTELRNGKVDSYLAEHSNRIYATVFTREDVSRPQFKLRIPASLAHNSLLSLFERVLGDSYKRDRDTILFFLYDKVTNGPCRTPLGTKSNLRMNSDGSLYYQLMPGVSERDLRSMTLSWLSVSLDGYNVVYSDAVVAPKGSSLREILDELKERGVLSIPPDAKLRCSEMDNALYDKEVLIDDQITNSYAQFRVDVVPPTQESTSLIQVCQCDINQWEEVVYFGFAFWLAVRPGEQVVDTKKRINELVKLEAQPKEVQLHRGRCFKDQPLNDNDILSEKMTPDQMLLLVRTREEPAQTNPQREVALKINN